MTALAAKASTYPIRTHVEMIHGLAKGADGVLVVSVFNANLPNDRGTVTHHRPGDVDAMIEAIEAHAYTPGANVYLGLQVMRKGLQRGQRGSEADIVAVLGLVADMDNDTRKNAGGYPTHPNYVLETSPGNLQPFWLFDRPVKPAEAKAIASSLKAATGSDHGTADITHVWRVPGTLNWPNAKKLARGRPSDPASVTVTEPWDGSVTSVDALRSALAPWAGGNKSVAPAAIVGDLPNIAEIEVSPAAAELLGACDVGDRSDHAAKVVEQLAYDGHSPETAAAVFLAAEGDWLKRYTTEERAHTDFARLWGKFGAPHTETRLAGASLTAALLSQGPAVAANDNIPESERELPPLPRMTTNPMSPDVAGGLLGDVARWITRTAVVPVPELSMVSAIALLGGMFGDKALGPTLSGLNMFATTLLDTAGGKGHPPKAIRSVAEKAGKPGAVTNGDPTSYSAIERILRKNPSTVVVFDEFGVTLQDVNGRNASAPAASIRKFLLAIYDQANSIFDGRIYASAETKKNDSPIKGPALTVLGMTTPETLYAGLSEQSISDGFINRFVFVTGSPPTDIKPPKLHRDNAPPEWMVEALQAAVLSFPKPANKLGVGKLVVEFDGGEEGDAYAVWSEVFMWQHSPVWNETERNINGRAAENTIRLATIRSISRAPSAPVVMAEDIEWAWAIVHASIQLVRAGADKHMSASPAEALRKAIVAALRDASDNTLPLSKLMVRRGVSGADHRELQSALRWLSDSGEVSDLTGRASPGRGSKFRWNGVGTATGTLERES